MSAPESSDPNASRPEDNSGPSSIPATEPEPASGRQRSGWGTPDEPSHDRRSEQRRADERRAEERRTADRREEARRADDQWASRVRAAQPSEAASLRVPTPTVSSPPGDSAEGAGRLLALILIIIVAFAGGVAVDQAA